jgi:hypothetical protein
MKYYLFIILILLSSCELIVIGEIPQEVKTITISRSNPVGTVLLFKTELDSNNIAAATDFIATPTGHKIMAVNKLDYYTELPMLRNKLKNLEISNIYEQHLDGNLIRVNVEFGYIRNLICDTKKLDSFYYIVNYKFEKTYY